mgnify:CR=1 FL=1
MAKVTRDNTSAQIIGITGSVGKTTLKNLVAFALKNYGKVYHSPHSYNNKFGVPLSLSNLKKNIEYGIFEIGMDKKGEIGNLSKIVKPEIAIITNISGAHFKNFNTLKDIAKAKAEIIDNILEGGNIILNKDDRFFNFLSNKAKKKGINVISFSSKKKADIFLLAKRRIKNHYIYLFSFRTHRSIVRYVSDLPQMHVNGRYPDPARTCKRELRRSPQLLHPLHLSGDRALRAQALPLPHVQEF